MVDPCDGTRKIYIKIYFYIYIYIKKKRESSKDALLQLNVGKDYKGVELYMAVKQKLIYDSTNLLAINDPRRTWNSTVVALNTTARIISF